MGVACPSNVTTWAESIVAGQTKVKTSQITELRDSIRREQLRRGVAQTTFSVPLTGKITATAAKELKDAVQGTKSFTWTNNYDSLQGKVIRKAIIDELRINVNDMEDDCLCDCDFCTCDCNYCTCDCDNSPCTPCTPCTTPCTPCGACSWCGDADGVD